MNPGLETEVNFNSWGGVAIVQLEKDKELMTTPLLSLHSQECFLCFHSVFINFMYQQMHHSHFKTNSLSLLPLLKVETSPSFFVDITKRQTWEI